MNEHDFLIWSDDPYHTEDIEEYKKNMEEEMPGELDDYTDAEICERMAQESADWLDDERCNLDKELGTPIVVLVDLGLWDDRRKGWSYIPSGNIKDCLQGHCRSGDSYNTFYVTPDGEFCQDEAHHDGTNHYCYRAVRDGLSEEEKDNFIESLKLGDTTEEIIMNHTQPLGPVIAEVYGWDLAAKSNVVNQEDEQ